MSVESPATSVRAFAPGRVNLIGEHTDYNDGFVLPFAIEAGCTATVSVGGQGWRVASQQQQEPVSTSAAASPQDIPGWARYVGGALWLLTEQGRAVPALSIEIDSNVPLGAGLSSSAALVCSVATALDAALELELSAAELLALSRSVENDVVGAPTGGMDQLVSLRAVEGHALLCDMRDLTSTPLSFDPAAAGLALLVVDTRAPHQLVDGEYADRRSGCEEAAQALGVPALRDVSTAELPAALKRLDDERLRRYVRHVVSENERVLATAELLRNGDIRDIGPLLTASHASMRDDFAITVPEVDGAVETLLEAGALGARMTGGGFGGCVIALVEEDSLAQARDAVTALFADRGWRAPATFVATPGRGAHVV